MVPIQVPCGDAQGNETRTLNISIHTAFYHAFAASVLLSRPAGIGWSLFSWRDLTDEASWVHGHLGRVHPTGFGPWAECGPARAALITHGRQHLAAHPAAAGRQEHTRCLHLLHPWCSPRAACACCMRVVCMLCRVSTRCVHVAVVLQRSGRETPRWPGEPRPRSLSRVNPIPGAACSHSRRWRRPTPSSTSTTSCGPLRATSHSDILGSYS